MTATTTRMPEPIAIPARSDSVNIPDCDHIVCHCTHDNTAWCGLDVSDSEWSSDADSPGCPLCDLAEELNPTHCPWGCDCNECGGE